MQMHKTMRIAGVTLTAATLALLTAEGTAAAHERTTSPDLRGRVTTVASGDFVVQKYDGTTETVDTTSGTTYSEPGSSVALPGVVNGENVAVTLDSTTSSPTATNVTVFPERVSGTVTNVAGSTITLSNHKGTDTVLVSPSTKYYQKGATPTGVSAGETVSAFGLPDPSMSSELDAQVVAIFSPAQAPQPTPTTVPAPQPTPPAVNPSPHWPSPQGQAPAPQTPSAPSTDGWSRSAPNGGASHGPSGGPGSPGGFGGHHGNAGGSGGHR